jgi:hypothetical protein
MAYFHSYVWMEAVRCFQTATVRDPDCAMAWWGLNRAAEKWNRGDDTPALIKARNLLAGASDREQRLIRARAIEKGVLGSTPVANHRRQASQVLDEMLALYPEDEEAWYYRAQLAEGRGGGIPYYQALVRINPLHPGANHELVHYYDNSQRPALGWVNAENYLKSSPGVPHAWHMQAHLATRLGRWQLVTNRCLRSVELGRAYHRAMRIQPAEDHQFGHHIEVLTMALTHDGRFAEARKIKAEAHALGYRHFLAWFQLHSAERDWAAALTVAEEARNDDSALGHALAAIADLGLGKPAEASSEIKALKSSGFEPPVSTGTETEASPETMAAFISGDQRQRLLWEAEGQLLCQTGQAAEGLNSTARV